MGVVTTVGLGAASSTVMGSEVVWVSFSASAFPERVLPRVGGKLCILIELLEAGLVGVETVARGEVVVEMIGVVGVVGIIGVVGIGVDGLTIMIGSFPEKIETLVC